VQTLFLRTRKAALFAAIVASVLLARPSASFAEPPPGEAPPAEPPKTEEAPAPPQTPQQTPQQTPPGTPTGEPPPAPNATPPMPPPRPPNVFMPPPGFVPYGFGAPPPQREEVEDDYEKPYESGPIPPDYQLHVRPRKSMILAGASVFAAFYSLAALGALNEPDSNEAPYGVLGIPVLGPFILVGAAEWRGDSGIPTFIFLFDGLSQAAGVALVVAGFAKKEQVLVRKDLSSREPEILIGPGSIGMKMRF